MVVISWICDAIAKLARWQSRDDREFSRGCPKWLLGLRGLYSLLWPNARELGATWLKLQQDGSTFCLWLMQDGCNSVIFWNSCSKHAKLREQVWSDNVEMWWYHFVIMKSRFSSCKWYCQSSCVAASEFVDMRWMCEQVFSDHEIIDWVSSPMLEMRQHLV